MESAVATPVLPNQRSTSSGLPMAGKHLYNSDPKSATDPENFDVSHLPLTILDP